VRRRLFFVALLLAALGTLVWRGFETPQAQPPSAQPSNRLATASSAITGSAASAAAGPYAGEEPSHLADALNSPSTDINADLRLLDSIFAQYRSAMHGGNPVGENAEITAALTGRNSLGFAFIPKNLPAIDTRGELCDRWGTPFFFHQISGEEMEIRSAGPDRKMWTGDDQVLTP
jgi:hypothetical protein